MYKQPCVQGEIGRLFAQARTEVIDSVQVAIEATLENLNSASSSVDWWRTSHGMLVTHTAERQLGFDMSGSLAQAAIIIAAVRIDHTTNKERARIAAPHTRREHA
jgi:hypothetical protein